jgi:hypothetical protein
MSLLDMLYFLQSMRMMNLIQNDCVQFMSELIMIDVYSKGMQNVFVREAWIKYRTGG